jgi:hypothetical protein
LTAAVTKATTGQIISAFKSANQNTSQVIDGFVSRPPKNKPAEHSQRPRMKSEAVHKRAEKTHALMRGGLKKPHGKLMDMGRSSAMPRIGTQLRAKTIRRHTQVEHFGNPIRSSGSHRVEAASGEVISRGPAAPAGTASAAAAPLPSMIASASHQKLERLLDEALSKADAHKQALRYQAARHFWQRRWFSGPVRWMTGAAAALIIAGSLFYAWRTVPQLSMKFAGLRAHVAAAVPSYRPDGYRIAGPAKAVSGAVVIKYKSASDLNKTYAITEQPSAFTSTMVSQNVVPKGAPVQTSQVEGNTVYIYGSSNDAAWVNNGVLYRIKNNSSLGSDQLIDIVSGLNP